MKTLGFEVSFSFFLMLNQWKVFVKSGSEFPVFLNEGIGFWRFFFIFLCQTDEKDSVKPGSEFPLLDSK
jgi:hypothetical protein